MQHNTHYTASAPSINELLKAGTVQYGHRYQNRAGTWFVVRECVCGTPYPHFKGQPNCCAECSAGRYIKSKRKGQAGGNPARVPCQRRGFGGFEALWFSEQSAHNKKLEV